MLRQLLADAPLARRTATVSRKTYPLVAPANSRLSRGSSSPAKWRIDINAPTLAYSRTSVDAH
ncbi:hypothetical protein KPSA3_07514 [Pseudomonas syringae pv. actinidiae]|uniref:Uncharacterized protein n=1 Tax=Pseudomonas syringae pv. actinidiae TaxID=103796 RepID=A0AAN4TQM2_PSESF|nr:hypothetical protein KPSA3_07514 [Pseudomonas syringae pv. actinidiae]